MKCRLAGMVAAAALLATMPLCAQTSRAKKTHAKAATHKTAARKTTPHTKSSARTVKRTAEKPVAKPAREAAPRMSQQTIDQVHAWEARQHGAAGGGARPAPAQAPLRTVPARTTPVKAGSRSESGMEAPARGAERDGEQPANDATSGREATAADFDKAAEEKARGPRRAAKPDPDVPLEQPGTPKSELRTEPKSGAPVKVKLTYVHGRLVTPAPMYGSHEVLVHQNVVADREGLTRIQDDADLESMRAQRLLVALPEGRGVRVDPRLARDRRYTRPWAAKFLADLGRAYAAKFGGAVQVNSAVRTVDFQTRLAGYNGNAAGVEGETASPHLTGEAVDLAKHGMSRTEIAWMRAYLAPLMAAGKIDVEEEFQQACFHISVYRRYVPEPVVVPRRMMTASEKRPGKVRHPAAAVAAAIR